MPASQLINHAGRMIAVQLDAPAGAAGADGGQQGCGREVGGVGLGGHVADAPRVQRDERGGEQCLGQPATPVRRDDADEAEPGPAGDDTFGLLPTGEPATRTDPLRLAASAYLARRIPGSAQAGPHRMVSTGTVGPCRRKSESNIHAQ